MHNHFDLEIVPNAEERRFQFGLWPTAGEDRLIWADVRHGQDDINFTPAVIQRETVLGEEEVPLLPVIGKETLSSSDPPERRLIDRRMDSVAGSWGHEIVIGRRLVRQRKERAERRVRNGSVISQVSV